MSRRLLACALLSIGGCTFHESIEIEFETSLAGARSAIVAIESEAGISVSAIDLASRPVPRLPVLEHDASIPMIVGARVYLESLAELGIETDGPLPPGEGGKIPESTVDRRRDQSCSLLDGDECRWRDGQLGPGLERFTSPALPLPVRCANFETATVHEPTEDTPATRVPIGAAVRLGSSALAVQVYGGDGPRPVGIDQLYLISEDHMSSLHVERPDLMELMGSPIQTLVRMGEAAVVLSCPNSREEWFLTRLGEDGQAESLTTEGLGACPDALSSFEETLFALMEDSSVRYLPRGASAWSSLSSFGLPIIPRTFIASGPEEAVALSGLELEAGYRDLQVLVAALGPEDQTRSDLELPALSQFNPASPTAIDGEVYWALGENIQGTYFFRGSSKTGWTPFAHRATQNLRALSRYEGLLLGTGFYGTILVIDPDRPNETCEDSVIVPASRIEQLVEMGGGRYLLSGRSNHDPASTSPRNEPQTFTVARVMTR